MKFLGRGRAAQREPVSADDSALAGSLVAADELPAADGDDAAVNEHGKITVVLLTQPTLHI